MKQNKGFLIKFQHLISKRFGYILPTKSQQRKINALVKHYWKEIKKGIYISCEGLKKREIRAQSPWHAWVLLEILHSKMIDIDDFVLDEIGNFHVPVYRGQANANYKPIPSIYRPMKDHDRKHQKKALEVFSFIFNQKFLWQRFGIELPLGSAKAAAQHYGIKTNLLDITANPAVAVYFASRSQNKKRGGRAAVFVFDMQKLLLTTCKLIFPPPVVERLYIQKGGFFEYNKDNIQDISADCLKIVFPFDPSFQLLDDRGNKMDIETTDEWFKKLIKWSNDWASSEISLPSKKNETDNFLIKVFDKIGYPSILTEEVSNETLLLHWLDNFVDMEYWYAIRIKHNKEFSLSGVCENIAKHNQDIVQFMININQELIKKLKSKGAPVSKIVEKERLHHIWVNALNSSK